MALIPCKQCGKSISSSASKCPHCGCIYSNSSITQPVVKNPIEPPKINRASNIKHCPRCKIQIPAETQKCNCGYQFTTVKFDDFKEMAEKIINKIGVLIHIDFKNFKVTGKHVGIGCLTFLFFIMLLSSSSRNDTPKVVQVYQPSQPSSVYTPPPQPKKKMSSQEILRLYNDLIQSYTKSDDRESLNFIYKINDAPENIKIKKYQEIVDKIKSIIASKQKIEELEKDSKERSEKLNAESKSPQKNDNKVINMYGFMVQDMSSFLSGKVYEVIYNGNHVLLQTSDTEFQSRGNFNLMVVYDGKTKVELKEEQGAFKQDWDTYREATKTEIDEMKSKEQEQKNFVAVNNNGIRENEDNIRKLHESIDNDKKTLDSLISTLTSK